MRGSTSRQHGPGSAGTLVALFAALVVSACGGGGGGGGGSGSTSAPATAAAEPPPSTAAVSVTVTDTSGRPIEGARVRVRTSYAPDPTSVTNALGVATFPSVKFSSLNHGYIDVSADGYFSPPPRQIPLVAGGSQAETVVVERASAAAAGVIATRPIAILAGGSKLTFEADVVVLDERSQPVQTLTAADFWLPKVDCAWGPCVYLPPSTVNDQQYVQQQSGRAPADSAGLVAPGVRAAYAAGLLLDVGTGFAVFDPGPQRLSASKVFLESVRGSDAVTLASFGSLSGQPLLTAHGGFVGDGRTYLGAVDSLAGSPSGDSRLFEAAAEMVAHVSTAGPAPAAGTPRWAVVLSRDAPDTCSYWAERCTNIMGVEAIARERGVSVVSITGLRSGDVAVAQAGGYYSVDGRLTPMAHVASATGGAFFAVEHPSQMRVVFGALDAVLSRSASFYRVRLTVETSRRDGFQPGGSAYHMLEIQVNPRVRLRVPVVVLIR